MTTLAADIGGTNTRVALCDTPEAPREVARFRNADHASLDAVLRAYLAARGHPPVHAACVAVAGPVRDGAARLTNLPWEIDAATLRAATGATEAHVINDMAAQGHALDDVTATRVTGPQTGCDARETRLVVGLGTGFNAAPVHPLGTGGYVVVPSECGHASLPVWDDASLALARTLTARHGFASIEEVLSGRGLMAVNAHVAGPDARADTAALIAALHDDPAPGDRATAAMFAAALGRVLGDLALVHLPFGGLYLIGGVARAMAPFLEAHGFAEAFRDKGRFAGFMEAFAVSVVADDYAALTGCARYVRRQG